ncbi:hypothetical protein LINGRAHAP2_LOCUS3156 [Linum grandiflorum]
MLCLYRHFAPNSTMTSSLVLATSVAPMIMNHGSVWSGSLRPPVAIKHGTCGSFRRRLTVTAAIDDDESSRRLITRMETDRKANVVGAMLSGITSMAALAVVYSKFSCQFDDGGDDQFPAVEMLATFSLSVRAAVGTEYWARWAHRALWHRSLWNLHKGLGMTMFGMAYMFVHDGMVHGRFPVEPLYNVPYLRRIAAAHQLHHADTFNGIPYGLFLGPQEVEAVGGTEELEKEVSRIIDFSI